MSERQDEPYFSSIMDYSAVWQDIWQNVIAQTQSQMMDFFQEHPEQSSALTTMKNDVFDPKLVRETFAQAWPKLLEHPEKLMELQKQHLYNVRQVWKNVQLQLQGQQSSPLFPTEIRDKRFSNPAWRENPIFSFLQQIYLLNSRLLRETISNIEGLDERTQRKLDFYTRHMIDALSPTNFPLTNPDVLEETLATKGENLIQGFRNYIQHTIDQEINIPITDMSAFRLGENLATTPGKIIFRNELFELIQYTPTTKKVSEIPLLIIPPWINKYYIFDLKQENSFVKWAVDSGLTVFIISWANPDRRHSTKTLSDYVLDGALTALDFVRNLTKKPAINVMGYCTGGVLLNCLMCYLKAKKADKIISATLVASPVDFREAGDLLVYVCEQQLKKLESHVQKKGYLEGKKMVQAFNLLRANDLIWSYYVNSYLMGKGPMPFDLLYWNCDAVRMPAKMHTDFLRKMYLENRLIQPGGIKIKGVNVDLRKIETPMFIMAAIDDHIAPWRAVFPMTQIGNTQKKFVLAGSGHVAGVINHPAKNKYHYWTTDTQRETAEEWLNHAQKIPGSWWIEWRKWLKTYTGKMVSPPKFSTDLVLDEAPGPYVKVISD